MQEHLTVYRLLDPAASGKSRVIAELLRHRLVGGSFNRAGTQLAILRSTGVANESELLVA